MSNPGLTSGPATTASPLLQVKGLFKSYPSGEEQLHILVDLCLEVKEGQMVAVTGASGSGKSTFLHLVGGMEKPDAGEIAFEGLDITHLEARELARFRNEKIGFVFQFHHLLPEFTALENVMFPLLLRQVHTTEAAEKASTLLDEVGLGQRLTHKPGELSGGEQQRVALARALVGEPKLLLGDEPTGNLDEHTSEATYTLLLEIHRRRRISSIIVTHNLKLAALCDDEKHLSEGKLH